MHQSMLPTAIYRSGPAGTGPCAQEAVLPRRRLYYFPCALRNKVAKKLICVEDVCKIIFKS